MEIQIRPPYRDLAWQILIDIASHRLQSTHYFELTNYYVMSGSNDIQTFDVALAYLTQSGFLINVAQCYYMTENGYLATQDYGNFIPMMERIINADDMRYQQQSADSNIKHRQIKILTIASVVVPIILFAINLAVFHDFEDNSGTGGISLENNLLNSFAEVVYPYSLNIRNTAGTVQYPMCQVKMLDRLEIVSDNVVFVENNSWSEVKIVSVSDYKHAFMNEHNQCPVETRGWIARYHNGTPTLSILQPQ